MQGVQAQQGLRQVAPNVQYSLDQSNSEEMLIRRNGDVGYILEENHASSGGAQLTKEMELAHQLNRFRFKNQKIIQKLLVQLESPVGSSEPVAATATGSSPRVGIPIAAASQDTLPKKVVLEQTKREIVFEKREMVGKLSNYLHEMDIVNQILPDFTFNPKQNESFVGLYKDHILANKKIPESFYSNLDATSHHSYFVENVSLASYDELILLLLVEEFIQLNDPSRSAAAAATSLTLDFAHVPQHLGLIDNLYNKVFLLVHPHATAVEGNQESGNPAVDNTPRYDVFILLVYDENLIGQMEMNSAMMKSQTFKSNGQQQQQYGMQTLLNNSQMIDRFNQAIVPQKYEKLLKRGTQIPKLSIKSLVSQMDSNNDGRVTKEDIRNFSHKNYIYYDDKIYDEMFNDIVRRRIVAYEDQRTKPLTLDEIWVAVLMHYKLGPDHSWVENPHPYRKEWVQMLEKAGERIPKGHDLPKLKIEAVRDQHQFSTKALYTLKPPMMKAASCIDIKNIPKKQYVRPFRAEAGIVVNNTEHIQEVVQDYKEQMSHIKEIEAFEKVVNMKFQHPDQGECPTIKFETKNYFSEADRLSKRPELYKHAPKNPIYTFIPENFNFQIHSHSQQGGNPSIESQTQDKRVSAAGTAAALGHGTLRGSNKYNKGTNTNIGFQPNTQEQQESFSQLREIDDTAEYDAESLMKTQSIRLSTQRVQQQPQRGSHAPSLHYNKAISLPRLTLQNQHANTTKAKTAYPHNVFDARFIERKNKIRQVLTPNEMDLNQKHYFLTTFKPENTANLKLKLAKNESSSDAYNPVSQVVFRESYPIPGKEQYVTRFKCEDMPNPHGVSDHDSRPKEALEREQKEKDLKQQAEQKQIDEFLGKMKSNQDWIKYFKLADIDHNFVDQQRPAFLDKGNFTEPSAILHNLLRGDAEYGAPFKLFHRTLRTSDRNLTLGQVPDSKF